VDSTLPNALAPFISTSMFLYLFLSSIPRTSLSSPQGSHPLTYYITIGLTLVSVVAVICVITPIIIVPLLPISLFPKPFLKLSRLFISPLRYSLYLAYYYLAYVIYWLYQYYMTSSREVQRLDAVSRSPIYALFSGITIFFFIFSFLYNF
jgi:hypothetical protein